MSQCVRKQCQMVLVTDLDCYTQKNNVSKFLASNLRKNFKPQEPNTEYMATAALGIPKMPINKKALKHLGSERNFDSFSMIVNILAMRGTSVP